MRPEIVDCVADRMHHLCQHNSGDRVRAIVDGMPLFVLTAPNTKMEASSGTLLGDNLELTQAMCRMLGRHLAFANTLPPDRLPLRVPLVFCGEPMHAHPCATPGSFDHVKKVNGAGMVVIPHWNDDNWNPIVDPPVTQTPAVHCSELGASLAVDSCFNPTFKSGTLHNAHLISRIWIHQRSGCSTTISAELHTTTGSTCRHVKSFDRKKSSRESHAVTRARLACQSSVRAKFRDGRPLSITISNETR